MLGGILAGRFGAKIVLFVAVLASSLISIISPGMARFNVAIFISIRALLGFTQGVIFPAMHSLLSGWAPPMERGILTGLSYAGAQVGNMLVMPLSGLLCRHGFDGGWPSIFYLFGAIGLFCLGKNKENNSPIEIKRRPIPLYSILTSKPVWAIFVGHFAGDWGSYTMALGIPSFLNDVLGLQLTSMGIVSALPYLAYFAFINIGGHFADKLQQKGVFSTLNCRRLAMLIAFGGQALMLVAIGYCGCHQHNLVILLLILSTGISGFQYAGFVVNYMDICPELSGFVLGIGNTLSCLAGLLSPIIMGWLTPNGSKEEWLLVFYVTAFILVVGALIFSFFASAEVQEWAKEDFNYSSNDAEKQEKQQKIMLNCYEDPLLNEHDQILAEEIIVSHIQADVFTNMVIRILDNLLTGDISLDFTDKNNSAKFLMELRHQFLYVLESNIYTRMPRTSFKLYSYCDEIIQIDSENKNLVEADDEYKMANFYCRLGVFLSATNYLLGKIIENDDIIKAINGSIKGIEFTRKEFSQKFNNSKNHLTPIVEEMRKILLEDKKLKFRDLKV
uniref:Major facilitator superfamily (MFS) profile domain-containing protein n=1 Tax=Meloidogyne javanica TaxID=6303 RepID=A0A915LRQ3_MELJA